MISLVIANYRSAYDVKCRKDLGTKISSIISEAARQYHHRHKIPSRGLQDLPRRRASMATPP